MSKAGSGGANAHQRLATALATCFDSLGGCDPATGRDLQLDRDLTVQSALFVVRLWIVPVMAVYAFGLGLAWVRRGFQVESK